MSTEPVPPSAPGVLLALAIQIAAECHAKDLDKADAPYILHPLRVMARAQSLPEQIVGVLHDVVEDGIGKTDKSGRPYTPERLTEDGFSSDVVEAVRHVTKQEGERGEEGYDRFIDRILNAPGTSGRIARRVKLWDLEDNMMLTRWDELDDKTLRRLQRYHRAHQKVSQAVARDLESNG
jgi:(p)ppGpp synthase/HD superfamily hydrolase